MKILYGIQGTGNGHISRAMEILPHLKQRGSVDILISGVHSELSLPFEVKYQCKGLGFVFGKKGGIDLLETYRKNRLKVFYREVKNLDVSKYDLVISDFEPVTAWACIQQSKTCIGLSNQASLLSMEVPKAQGEDFVGKFIIHHYAPCAINYGFNYKAYGNRIFTPIIRQSLREQQLTKADHYTVYLPSYADEKIIDALSKFKTTNWHVFSKWADQEYQIKNLRIIPLQKEAFEKSITSCTGVLTAAGFGTTSEALFMGKKLLVIPQRNQYEQACNAIGLKELGVTVVKSLKKKHFGIIETWLKMGVPIQLTYADQTSELVDEIIFAHHGMDDHYSEYLQHHQYSIQSV